MSNLDQIICIKHIETSLVVNNSKNNMNTNAELVPNFNAQITTQSNLHHRRIGNKKINFLLFKKYRNPTEHKLSKWHVTAVGMRGPN
jgi:hypothetical protein